MQVELYDLLCKDIIDGKNSMGKGVHNIFDIDIRL